MPAAILNDEEFIEIWNTHKSATAVAKKIGMSRTMVHKRRRNIEERHKIALVAAHQNGRAYDTLQTHHRHSARLTLGIHNGTVIVFSDAHFWPGIRTTAFKGLLWAIKELKPKAVICNGDAFDGASISRYPRIGWDNKPSVIEELHACQAYLSEIEETAKKALHNVKLIWTLGNHDARFENRLASNAPEYEKVKGFTLKDHFPSWEPCWSVWPTDDVCVKHRYANGVHAVYNNTLRSGKSIVTGHLHSLKVTPWTDYVSTRYGVDTGTLADIRGPQFTDYIEDNPVNWRSGFAVLTFVDGALLWPELVHRYSDTQVEFRGKLIEVGKL